MRIPGILACLLIPAFSLGQETALPDYPKGYFRNPLDIPIVLAGNFGECRWGHFHSGLDIKTESKENMRVHAAAAGYISRIKTEKGGFGHAIYIAHPNGFTTLYAHLNDFAPFLQKYLREQQYARQRWNLDISFPANKFPVSKGQFIAKSGNTGGSTAPHLHFEIRDTKTQHPLNPQFFGFEINDNIPPLMREVVFYKGNTYDRNNVAYKLRKRGDEYKPATSDRRGFSASGDTIEVPAGMIGVGINTDDHMNGSTNTITFATAQLLLDDKVQTTVTLDDIGYNVSRYIHGYVDFYAKEEDNKWVQCLFKLPGNRLSSIFTTLNENDGRLDLQPNDIHKVSVVLTDDNGNVSTTSFYVKPIQAADEQTDNTENCTPFYAGKVNKYSDPNIAFTIGTRLLYDDICFSFDALPDSDALSDRYRLHYPYVPLHRYFPLFIKPKKTIPLDLRNKVILKYSDGKNENAEATHYTEKGMYKTRVRNFGYYWLAIDTTAPSITSHQKQGANLSNAKRLSFTIKDDLTSVKSYRGMLDGEWLCIEQHRNNFFYEFDEHCPKGKHQLILTAKDENGNESEYVLNFSR